MRLRGRVQAAVAQPGGRVFPRARGFSRRVAGGALVAGALLVFALTLWLVIKVLPEQLAATGGIKDPSRHAEEVGRTRTAILASLAGVLAGIGAYYTHRTFELNRQGHELNRQGQITERFTRAVDQLGNASLDVRLGGIYALERLARESRDDHGPIIEILTAYIREHTRSVHQDRRTDTENSGRVETHIATDVQAALTVLAVESWRTIRLNRGGSISSRRTSKEPSSSARASKEPT
jgi:hypothetical protein